MREPDDTSVTASRPLVSVVTPVYNTEKYLAECIESVLRQTYRHFEYIIVDNQSSDRSLEIANRYAARDDRIRVHSNEAFLRQMPNWNHALSLLSPDSAYCKVVHADDWLFPECLEAMVACAQRDAAIGLVGSYRLDETKVNLDGLPFPSHFTPGRDIARLHLLGELFLFGSPTSLLIRSDIVRDRYPFYDEDDPHADVDACLEILRMADFGFVHKVLTFTRRHNESASSAVKRFETRWPARLKALEKHGPQFLTPPELDRRRNQAYGSYYRFLARQLLAHRERAFWQYHRSELAKIGHPLSYRKLSRAVASEVLHHPRRSIRELTAGFKRRPATRPS